MEGGKLFDLAERFYPNQDVSGLVEKINGLILFGQQNHNLVIANQYIHHSITEKQMNLPAITIGEIKQLGNNPAITNYLESLGIMPDVAKP